MREVGFEVEEKVGSPPWVKMKKDGYRDQQEDEGGILEGVDMAAASRHGRKEGSYLVGPSDRLFHRKHFIMATDW